MSYRWELITMTAPFAPRDGAGALMLNGTMYLLGGWNPLDKANFPKVCNSEVWASTDGLDWTEIQEQAPWEGRHCAGWVEYRDELWIVGGDCNQGHYQRDVWKSPDGVNWTQVCDDLPWGNRTLHMTHAFRDRLWVLGGQTMPAFVDGSAEAFYNDVWCSEDGVTWTQVLEHAPWTPRGAVAGHAVFQDRMWVIGGATYDTPTTPLRRFYNDVWSSADGAEWTCHTAAAAFPRRMYHEVAVWDGRLWLMEGYDRGGDVENGGNRNDVWYSAEGEHWIELPDTPWKPRHAASLFLHDDALWMVAGNNLEADVWKLVRR